MPSGSPKPKMKTNEFIAREMARVKEVEAVLTAKDGKVLYVCTVVRKSSPEIRARVFERERAIIDEFSNLEFDFNVTARRGRDLKSFAKEPGFELAYARG